MSPSDAERPSAERFLTRLLAKTPPRLLTNFRVSRKGCGKGSGDAPRALKTIALNRLHAGGAGVAHHKGDLYSARVGTSDIPFTFRTTTSLDVRRRQGPWFNVSIPESGRWIKDHVTVIVLHVVGDPAQRNYEARAFVLSPDLFADMSDHPTKPSELLPSSLFEIVPRDDGSFALVNSMAKDAQPKPVPSDCVIRLELTDAESDFLTAAYAVERIEDPTAGGRFEPIEVLVDPGEATEHDIAELLSELSAIYYLMGGSGITFTLTDARTPAGVAV